MATRPKAQELNEAALESKSGAVRQYKIKQAPNANANNGPIGQATVGQSFTYSTSFAICSGPGLQPQHSVSWKTCVSSDSIFQSILLFVSRETKNGQIGLVPCSKEGIHAFKFKVWSPVLVFERIASVKRLPDYNNPPILHQ